MTFVLLVENDAELLKNYKAEDGCRESFSNLCICCKNWQLYDNIISIFKKCIQIKLAMKRPAQNLNNLLDGKDLSCSLTVIFYYSL